MSEVSNIIGSGTSKTVISLIKKLEEKLNGQAIDMAEVSDVFEHFRFKFEIIKNVSIDYGKKQERASQKSVEEECSTETKGCFSTKRKGENSFTSFERNGRSGINTLTISERISEFCDDLRNDFNRQHVYRRRKDNRLIVHIFEYFKYLEDSYIKPSIINDVCNGNMYSFSYHICDYLRQEDDLILVIDAQTLDLNYEENMLLYPMLSLNIGFYDNKVTLENEGFYIKWAGVH